MSLSHSPSLVTNGLVLCLDAINIKSYIGSGTLWNDLSVSNINGTLVNSPTYSNGGINLLSASAQYISTSYNSIINATTTFTLDITFKSTTITNEQMLFATSKNNATGWHVEIYQSKPILQVYPGGTYTFSNTALSSNTTYNYIITYNNGTITHYLNGVLNGSSSQTFTPSTNPLTIGAWTYAGSPALFFGGTIYSVKFYNRVLTTDEISQNFNAIRGRYGI
jgi:hypothetical protein